ncbi:hypothetical protein ROTAS13_00972 [Roseomonas sp. TAS13]|nr:hypothetical protein ROTAS13_00972 [Roseomonas sp. TAS13]
MQADLPALAEELERRDLHPRQRRPAGLDPVPAEAAGGDVAADVPVPLIRADGQDVVAAGAIVDPARRLQAGAEMRGIGEFRAFLRAAAHVVVAGPGGQGGDVAALAPHQHEGPGDQGHAVRVRVRRLLGLPEGMRVRQGERQEGLEGPVGRALGIVVLAHQQVRPAIADAHPPGLVQHRLLQPPADLPCPEPADHAPGQRLHPGIGQRAPEGGGGEAVGQRTADRQRGAVIAEPVAEAPGEGDRTVAVAGGALRVAPAGQGGIGEAIELQREAVVVVDMAAGPVAVPAVAEVEFLDPCQVPVAGSLVDRQADALHAQPRHDRKEVPVVVGHGDALHAAEPGGEVALRGFRQRLPQMLGHQGQGEAQRRHLHRALVVVGDGLPVFRMRGVAAARQPLPEQGPAVEIAAARREGREAPERAGIALEPFGLAVEMRAVQPQPHLRAPRAEAGPQRRVQVEQQVGGIGAGAQRVPADGRVQVRVRHRMAFVSLTSFAAACFASIRPKANSSAALRRNWPNCCAFTGMAGG